MRTGRLLFALLVAVPIGIVVAQPAPKTSESPSAKVTTPGKEGDDLYVKTVRPLLQKYCMTCHNDQKNAAGMSLEPYRDTASAKKAKDLWEGVKEEVENKQMPPKGKPAPTDDERKAIAAWIDSVAIKVDCGLARDPGRPTIRRLNRTEYNNTIRDLLGVNLKPADDFPSDDVGYGFDNIGDVLSMPPILLEKYLTAAERVVEAAIVTPKPIKLVKDVLKPQNVRTSLGPLAKQRDRIALHSNGNASFGYDFLHDGEYVLRARAYGDQAGKELPKMTVEFDKNVLKTFDVEAVKEKPKLYEHRLKVAAGRHEIAFAFINDFLDKEAKPPVDRNLNIEIFEVEGPFNPVPKELPAAQKQLLSVVPKSIADRPAAAAKILGDFATRAYRRPVTEAEVARLMKVWQYAARDADPFEAGIKHAMKAVLVSPNFLFRIEKDKEPNNPEAVHPVGEYELATRLSYFLWASMPDAVLTELAGKGELRKPGVLEAQVKRMLKDPKSAAFVENFAGQWLMLRTLATMNPDKGTFRSFDLNLRTAMIKETELFFDHILRDDRSVMEFLDADYTFVNERLAKHYGIPNVSGNGFRKVTLTDKSRGGVITQASVLTVTSNPTRTSPVKRGKWILENILGTPPPPPPPDVPELDDEKAKLTGSLRQRMEQHRANPACATCHQKMDPLGFGLENFDGIGGYRAVDDNFKIDPSGTLPDGAKFSGPAELRKVLLAKGDLFRKNLAEKMLTYALGRGLEYYDKCAIDDTVKSLKSDGDRFSALILAVVKSDPFQKRRGGTGKP
jgi:mono/diheme cytochrome c family protein